MCLLAPYQRPGFVNDSALSTAGSALCGLTSDPCGGVNPVNLNAAIMSENFTFVMEKNLNHYNSAKPGNLTINLWNVSAVCFYLFLLSSTLGIMTIFFSTFLKKSNYIYGIPSSIAIISYIIYSIEPLIESFKEIKYVSLFYFYKGHDPLNNGFHPWYWIIFVLVSIIFASMSLYYWK